MNSAAEIDLASMPVAIPGPKEGVPAQTRSMRWSFSWTFVGNVVYSGCQWGTLVLLAKIGNPVMVGQYGLAIAVAQPVLALTNLQVTSLQTTDIRERYRFGDYLGFRLLTTALALLVISAIPLLAHYTRDTAMVILVVGLAQAVEAVREIYHGQLQFRDHMDRIAKSMILRALLGLAALSLAVYFTHSVVWGALGLAFGRALVSVFYDMSPRTQLAPPQKLGHEEWKALEAAHRGELRPRWNRTAQTQLLRLCGTLGVIALLVALIPNVPRYFIVGKISERALGIFTAAAFLVSSGNLVVTALGQSAFVRLARFYAAGELARFRTLLWKLLAVVTVLGLGGVGVAALFGKELLTVLYRPEYAEHTDVLIAMMISGTLSYISSLLGAAVTAARFFKQQIPMLIVVVGAAALSSYLLIPKFGLVGAAYSAVVTSAVVCGGQAVLLLLMLNNKLRPTADPA